MRKNKKGKLFVVMIFAALVFALPANLGGLWTTFADQDFNFESSTFSSRDWSSAGSPAEASIFVPGGEASITSSVRMEGEYSVWFECTLTPATYDTHTLFAIGHERSDTWQAYEPQDTKAFLAMHARGFYMYPSNMMTLYEADGTTAAGGETISDKVGLTAFGYKIKFAIQSNGDIYIYYDVSGGDLTTLRNIIKFDKDYSNADLSITDGYFFMAPVMSDFKVSQISALNGNGASLDGSFIALGEEGSYDIIYSSVIKDDKANVSGNNALVTNEKLGGYGLENGEMVFDITFSMTRYADAAGRDWETKWGLMFGMSSPSDTPDGNGVGFIGYNIVSFGVYEGSGSGSAPAQTQDTMHGPTVYYVDGETMQITAQAFKDGTLVVDVTDNGGNFTYTFTGLNFTGYIAFYMDTPHKTAGNRLIINSFSLSGNLQPEIYTVDYVLNGGTLTEGNPETYISGDAFIFNNPEKDGCVFGGWYESSDFSGAKTTGITAGTTGDKVFYARWFLKNVQGFSFENNSFSMNDWSSTGATAETSLYFPAPGASLAHSTRLQGLYSITLECDAISPDDYDAHTVFALGHEQSTLSQSTYEGQDSKALIVMDAKGFRMYPTEMMTLYEADGTTGAGAETIFEKLGQVTAFRFKIKFSVQTNGDLNIYYDVSGSDLTTLRNVIKFDKEYPNTDLSITDGYFFMQPVKNQYNIGKISAVNGSGTVLNGDFEKLGQSGQFVVFGGAESYKVIYSPVIKDNNANASGNSSLVSNFKFSDAGLANNEMIFDIAFSMTRYAEAAGRDWETKWGLMFGMSSPSDTPDSNGVGFIGYDIVSFGVYKGNGSGRDSADTTDSMHPPKIYYVDGETMVITARAFKGGTLLVNVTDNGGSYTYIFTGLNFTGFIAFYVDTPHKTPGNRLVINNFTVSGSPILDIRFDGNYPGAASIAPVEVLAGGTISSPPSVTRDYYNFSYWAARSGSAGNYTYTRYYFTQPFDSVATLYAVWAPVDYAVNYHANGGTNSALNPDRYNIETATITLVNPSRQGYAFEGWYDNDGFTGSKITQITKGSHGVLNLYADWEPIIYNLQYGLNGGTLAANNPATYTVESAFSLNNPAKDNYTFDGWYEASDFSGASVSAITVGTTGNKTLYAKWSPVEYSINYTLNGGSGNGNPEKYTVESGNIALSGLTKAGYEFAGWYTNSGFEGDAVVSVPAGSSGAKAFYAKWKLVVYTIEYVLNDGINSSENAISFTVETAEITLVNPSREGYIFDGWYDNEACEGAALTKIFQGSVGNIRLYAKWTKEEKPPKGCSSVTAPGGGISVTALLSGAAAVFCLIAAKRKHNVSQTEKVR